MTKMLEGQVFSSNWGHKVEGKILFPDIVQKMHLKKTFSHRYEWLSFILLPSLDYYIFFCFKKHLASLLFDYWSPGYTDLSFSS